MLAASKTVAASFAFAIFHSKVLFLILCRPSIGHNLQLYPSCEYYQLSLPLNTGNQLINMTVNSFLVAYVALGSAILCARVQVFPPITDQFLVFSLQLESSAGYLSIWLHGLICLGLALFQVGLKSHQQLDTIVVRGNLGNCYLYSCFKIALQCVKFFVCKILAAKMRRKQEKSRSIGGHYY